MDVKKKIIIMTIMNQDNICKESQFESGNLQMLNFAIRLIDMFKIMKLISSPNLW